MEATTDTKSTITLCDRANSQLQSTIFQCSHHHQLCSSSLAKQDPAPAEVPHCHCCYCWNAPPTASMCSLPLLDLHKHSASINEWQWQWCFPHGGIQCHTFASYTLPCQMPLCQSTPLLPSVTRQHRVMGYWWEGSPSAATPPPFASDITAQHNKLRDITFVAALIHNSRGSVQHINCWTLMLFFPVDELGCRTRSQCQRLSQVWFCTT